MSYTLLVFDFSTNEEAAQQARHKVEAWKQGFRLGSKIELKFERPEEVSAAEKAGAPEAEVPGAEVAEAGARENAGAKQAPKKKSSSGKRKAGSKDSDNGDEESASRVRVMVRLAFSDHEKLTLQRWLDRISSEEPFKSAKSEVLRPADPDFEKTAELFDSLD